VGDPDSNGPSVVRARPTSTEWAYRRIPHVPDNR
jgi:hypothetical protein